ncbi:methyltransferase domain-containing protein [Candidatus Pelagibacter ubique]|uniref:methyltransferase domain-containing protein n=1 Tax=Pelagibacter ubique TaxID=198252 RepID=UPI0003C7F343
MNYKIRNLLYEKEVLNVDVNSNELLKIHLSILRKKKLLNSAFLTFYKDMAKICDKYFFIDGLEVELGSGVGFFKDIRKNILTSEFQRKGIKYDLELDATKLNLNNDSIKCIYGINVFHHIPYPTKFFDELIRVLKKNGGCILIEPHNGFFSRVLHKNLHKDEYFDTNKIEWDNSETFGPLANANQALAHNIFVRDIEIFKKKYGQRLDIIHQQYEINGLRYLFSGGLNFKQFLPSFLNSFLKMVEALCSPLAKYWTPYKMIVIKKIK